MTSSGPKPAPTDDPRGRLRAALAFRDHVQNAVQQAIQAVNRTQETVEIARVALAYHDHVDDALAAYLASLLQEGAGAAHPLPADLAAARDARDRCRRTLQDAQAAARLRVAEAREAQHAADEGDRQVRLAIDVVMESEASAIVAEMRVAETKAARLRMLAAAYLDARVGSETRVADHELAVLAHDKLHAAMLGTARHLNIQPDSQIWKQFAAALAGDAAAEIEW